jgi:methylated-DNA-[protein]-cysteine S-methyltransferase
MKLLEQWKFESMIGPLYLVSSSDGLRGIFWEKQNIPYAKILDGVLEKTVHQLDEYFSNKRKFFSVPLELTGTPFQLSVWNQLQKIPYGRTITYKELAAQINNPKAVRAVGTANGKNPLCIVIPCHRVVASDGSMAGFSGGIENKKRLLAIEAF